MKDAIKVRVTTPEKEFVAELSDDMDRLFSEVSDGPLHEDSHLVDHAKTFAIEPDDPEFCEPFYSTLIGDVILQFGAITFTVLP